MASGRARTWLRELRPPPLLLLLLLLGPWPAAGHGGKYSREKNEPEPSSKREPGGEFRMEKLNQLWEKAQRLDLPPLKLSELHADLKIQERDEFKWKKLKAEGLDEDGEKEAKLARGLSVILAKYGLDGRKDARAVSSNSISHGPADHSLEDPRLEKLWHKAKTSGKFSSEELDKLWRELQHHKEKVHEYNVLLETLSRTEEIHENVISPVDVSRVKEDALQVGHAELKDKLRDISQGFDRLQRVSHQGYGDQAGFEEPRVLDLWDMAQSANFTEKELEAFREELKHFEAKIEKHNHYQKQLEISHQKLKHVESLGDQEHVSRNRERYAVLEEKTKELGYKVHAAQETPRPPTAPEGVRRPFLDAPRIHGPVLASRKLSRLISFGKREPPDASHSRSLVRPGTPSCLSPSRRVQPAQGMEVGPPPTRGNPDTAEAPDWGALATLCPHLCLKSEACYPGVPSRACGNQTCLLSTPGPSQPTTHFAATGSAGEGD